MNEMHKWRLPAAGEERQEDAAFADAAAMEAVWARRAASLRASRAAQRAAGAAASGSRALIARLGRQRFALPIEAVTGIIPMRAVQQPVPIPGAPSAFLGLLVVHGEVRPVFAADALFGADRGADEVEEPGRDAAGAVEGGTHVILLRPMAASGEDEIVGLRFDRAEETVLLPAMAIEAGAAAAGRFVRYIENASGDDGAAALIVDVPALLAYLRGGGSEAAPSGGGARRSEAPSRIEGEEDR
jgi:chemotaxis signal transduction protein